MKLSDKELKKLIRESLQQEGFMDYVKKGYEAVKDTAASAYDSASDAYDSAKSALGFGPENYGCFIFGSTDDDVIGPALQGVLGSKEKIKIPLPSGHASGLIIKPTSPTSGKVTHFSFGPPVCKKPKGIIDSLLSKNPVPVMTSMVVHVKNKGTVKLDNYQLTDKLAKAAAKKLGKGVTYAAFNGVNVDASLRMVGKDGRCKAYSIVPFGLSLSRLSSYAKMIGIDFELDADNCASFAIDALTAGKPSLEVSGVDTVQLLSSPSVVAKSLQPISDFSGKT